MSLIRTPIVDKNGKQTTVLRKPERATTMRDRIARLGDKDGAAQRRRESEQKAAELRKRKHDNLVSDLDRNLNPKVNPDGTVTVSVFRSGEPNPPAARGVESDSYTKADAMRPEGRQGRVDAVFAAPSLGGVVRWVKGSHGLKPDVRVRELRVVADDVYVYKIRDWEDASAGYSMIPKERTASGNVYYTADELNAKYWDNGMRYSEWVALARQDDSLDPEEWELLIGVDQVDAVRSVSDSRVLDNIYDTAGFTTVDEMTRIFKDVARIARLEKKFG